MDLRSVAVLFLWEGGEREKYAREACAACRRGFVGGWLLGCRESAKSVFQKYLSQFLFPSLSITKHLSTSWKETEISSKIDFSKIVLLVR